MVQTEAPGCPPEWVEAIASWAAADPRILAVYLYGSRVRGTHRPDSDLDVAVILNGDEDDTAENYWFSDGGRIADELAALVPVEVHLEPAFAEDERVMPAVRAYGVCAYRQPGFVNL